MFLSLTLFSCSDDVVNSEPPPQINTAWVRTFGGQFSDIGFAAAYGHNHTILAAGYTNSVSSGRPDFYFSIMDTLGGILRTGTIGDAGADVCRDATGCFDQGFILAGLTGSFGAGGYDVYLVRLDSLGDTMWSRTYGGPGDDRADDIIQCSEGGFLMTGWSDSQSDSDDVYIVRTDNSGNVLWERNFGGNLNDHGTSATELTGGDFIIAGYTQSTTDSGYHVLLIRCSRQGDSLWSRVMGHGRVDAVVEISEGEILLGANTKFTESGFDERRLILVDSLGDEIVARSIDNSLDDHYLYDMILLPDGSICIGGYIDWSGAGRFPELSFCDGESLTNMMAGGILETSITSSISYISALTCNPGGEKIYAVGSVSKGSGQVDMCLWCIDNY